MSKVDDIVVVENTGGGMPPSKWEEGLFEQVVRGHQFAVEWDAGNPAQGQTAADALPGYISLFADFFGEGNFHFPTTHFFSSILTFYGFHVSQLSPMGMVQIRHFEFVCQSQGEEPTVEKFRALYQLQSNLGFFSFAIRSSKKILINPPRSYHDWKVKFFFIREEVIPIVMEFRDPEPIPKEDMKIPRGASWYEKLLALPNQAFGEQVLVVAGMSERWPHDSTNVPFLLLDDEKVELYHRAFLAHAGVMGVRPLREGEEFWYEQI
ncbi:hypothetical protein HanRHA438_Chr11g0510411 [Helianthus annuus]|nr:hypothetical protein HanHA300_Chr11g0408361 [Helianthus annuus]KAJ0510027.1 hypothetical protein HanIR_Chr11g0535951 [Helianthus annuus]KAJ0517985.1 hypothetical protein HanHA89_Chr11g0432061 [Helianthus annuus]KAJ0686005.1 hypothetical protein HanLR1_Chr11g0409601 [Helianthus annuus]KAJ0689860.1 hypothetical protein HanOQP8_Chr11g0411041 [Helianthus annuus]